MKFLIVGAVGWLVNVAIFWLLTRGTVPPLPAATVSYLVSNLGMWLGNRVWTFGPSGEHWLLEYVRYLIVGTVATLGVNLSLLWVFVNVVGMPELIGQVISLTLAVPVAFLAFRHWAFATPRDRR